MTRISIILAIVMLGLPCASFADDKSDCLNNCENDKRANSMYCPPAGGYSDNEHNQCIEKAAADFKKCAEACSPSSAMPPAETTPPAAPEDNPVPVEQQPPPGDNPPPPE